MSHTPTPTHYFQNELVKKTSKIRLTYDSHPKQTNDKGKIGKCAECFEWFIVIDSLRTGHSVCDSCRSHNDIIEKFKHV